MSRRLVVVDDDPDIRDIIQEILQRRGYDVTVAANGKEALERMRDLESPAAVLLDLMMPVMDGWEFRRRQLDDPRLRAVPVIVLSGDVATERRAAELDAHAFLRKPIEMKALVEVVARFA